MKTPRRQRRTTTMPSLAGEGRIPAFVTEDVALDQLKPHSRNYRVHPDDEIAHLMQSIQENEVYRPIVVARDNTILIGHGTTEAARRLGLATMPVYRKDWDPEDPRAIKLMVGDNEIGHLAEIDDRMLTELLRELKDAEVDLLGTGYDALMLANLVYVTRPASEIRDLNAAAQWVGMPEYALEGEDRRQIIVNFAHEDDRAAFCRLLDLDAAAIPLVGPGRSIWWPEKAPDDKRSIRFTTATGGERDV